MTLDSLFLQNLFSPPLLFFVLGCIATLLRTDLEIPEPIGKLLSLYLLMAIGFKGGVALAANELGLEALTGLFLALLLSVTVPLYVFFILRRSMSPADAAATAATYGSISAVTFVACTSYLDAADIAWNGYLVAAMALMESPAIILGLLLFRLQQSDSTEPLNFKPLLRESFLNSSVFLILGSLAVGWISGERGKAQLAPFVDELFVGVLCLFLLDMGIVAVRRLMDLNTSAAKNLSRLFLFGISLPLLNAGLALTLVTLADLSLGDALLLTVLGASASYIAVPAAMRLALPEANPSLYLTMSLAVTFPFNLLIGIPLYHQILLRIL